MLAASTVFYRTLLALPPSRGGCAGSTCCGMALAPLALTIGSCCRIG